MQSVSKKVAVGDEIEGLEAVIVRRERGIVEVPNILLTIINNIEGRDHQKDAGHRRPKWGLHRCGVGIVGKATTGVEKIGMAQEDEVDPLIFCTRERHLQMRLVRVVNSK